MQLGDWVEFETIVVKQPTANGNKPATTRLARKRRGQVVGERHVYDVTKGTPPALTNRQTVLLVAVSLHRHYRVFPTDVQPAPPPRPRQPKVATVAQPAMTVPATPAPAKTDAPNDGTGKTFVPTAIELENMVAVQISLLTMKRQAISSCGVAYQIRCLHPDAHILHDDVLRALGEAMTPLVAQREYRVIQPLCGDKRHVWYMPI